MCWSIWRPGMARAKPNWPDSSVFLTGALSSLTKSPKKFRYLNTHSANGRTGRPCPGDCSFYILLCMFNGFAFARPFCQAIKVSLTGVEF
jgi:hypothetical protein